MSSPISTVQDHVRTAVHPGDRVTNICDSIASLHRFVMITRSIFWTTAPAFTNEITAEEREAYAQAADALRAENRHLTLLKGSISDIQHYNRALVRLWDPQGFESDQRRSTGWGTQNMDDED